MRKQLNGLYALTLHQLGQYPLSGKLFVFVSRRAIQLKVLYFDRTGFCLWSKRLEAGRFISDWCTVRTREMDWTGLKLLLDGIEPARQRKRFRLGERPRSSPSSASQHLVNLRNAQRDCNPPQERQLSWHLSEQR